MFFSSDLENNHWQHALLPPKCCKLKNIPQLFLLLLFSPLDSHLSLLRNLGVHHLNSTSTCSSSSPISIKNSSTSSLYNLALVLFLVATFSRSLAICKASHSILPCVTFSSFHNLFSFAIRSFQSF